MRVWDQTLGFLKDNDLLHNIYYVDLLNDTRSSMASPGSQSTWTGTSNNGRRRAAPRESMSGRPSPANTTTRDRARFTPASPMTFSPRCRPIGRSWIFFLLTYNRSVDWRVMAPFPTAALDVHYWFVMNPLLPDQTGYWENIHALADSDLQFPKVQAALLKIGPPASRS